MEVVVQQRLEKTKLVGILRNVEYNKIPVKAVVYSLCYEEFFQVAFVFHVKDVCSDDMIPINLFRTIPTDLSEEEVVNLIRWSILDFEKHEMEEHFYYKGVKIFDPHKGEELANGKGSGSEGIPRTERRS